MSKWVNEVVQLAKFALTQPQACYAAYTFGLKCRWTYFLRTLPDIHKLLEPLENALSQALIPAITEHECNQLDRDILALPVHLEGLGLGNPSCKATCEYASSVKVTSPLVDRIESQTHQLQDETLVKKSLQLAVKSQRAAELKNTADKIWETVPIDESTELRGIETEDCHAVLKNIPRTKQ